MRAATQRGCHFDGSVCDHTNTGGNMSAGMVGYIIGGFFASILLPVLILVVARFVGPMRRNPKVVYSVCAVLALLVCAGGANGADNWWPPAIAAVLALLFLLVGYVRETKKSADPP
jgi:hypothetical protein